MKDKELEGHVEMTSLLAQSLGAMWKPGNREMLVPVFQDNVKSTSNDSTSHE